MWIAAVATAAALMLPTSIEQVTYKQCMYNCYEFCTTGYTDSERADCEKRRLNCQRNCILQYPTEFKGCNKGWQPTATGCKCIKPLLSSGVCPH